MTRPYLSFIGASVLLALAPAVAAQDAHGYAGLSLGQAHGDFDAPFLLQHQLPLGSSLGLVNQDQNAAAVKLFAGYRFNTFWSLEGGYARLGALDLRGTATPAGELSGRIRLQALTLDAVGFLPLSERLSLTARVGGVLGRTVIDYQGQGGVVPRHAVASRSTGSVKFGAGMQYAISPGLSVRFDAERFRFDDVEGGHGIVHVYSLGLLMPTP